MLCVDRILNSVLNRKLTLSTKIFFIYIIYFTHPVRLIYVRQIDGIVNSPNFLVLIENRVKMTLGRDNASMGKVNYKNREIYTEALVLSNTNMFGDLAIWRKTKNVKFNGTTPLARNECTLFLVWSNQLNYLVWPPYSKNTNLVKHIWAICEETHQKILNKQQTRTSDRIEI